MALCNSWVSYTTLSIPEFSIAPPGDLSLFLCSHPDSPKHIRFVPELCLSRRVIVHIMKFINMDLFMNIMQKDTLTYLSRFVLKVALTLQIRFKLYN